MSHDTDERTATALERIADALEGCASDRACVAASWAPVPGMPGEWQAADPANRADGEVPTPEPEPVFCPATMPGHRCARAEHADDRHQWTMTDEEYDRRREEAGVHIAEGMTVRIIDADGSTRVGTVGEMVEADGLTNWTLIPDDEPDPLDEDDHRPRHDRDGDHWHKGPHGWTSEGPTGHGDDRLEWLADSYGPLTFCDCDDAATIEAENGATD